jgi:UDP-N-acetylglucosamine:LPS N-acetylglucosamine transferase
VTASQKKEYKTTNETIESRRRRTGGHIFPAVAIANEIKKLVPHAEILFVGALGKMEMEKVPAAGYKIIGVPIAGLQRKLFTLG